MPDADGYLQWDEPCTTEICGWRCWRERPTDSGFTRDVHGRWSSGAEFDGEGPCGCDHHDEYSGPLEGPEQ